MFDRVGVRSKTHHHESQDWCFISLKEPHHISSISSCLVGETMLICLKIAISHAVLSGLLPLSLSCVFFMGGFPLFSSSPAVASLQHMFSNKCAVVLEPFSALTCKDWKGLSVNIEQKQRLGSCLQFEWRPGGIWWCWMCTAVQNYRLHC